MLIESSILTIAISTYNRVERLEKTIHQLHQEIIALKIPNEVEIIVVDNASTDGTQKFLQNISFPNVKVIRNSVNQGMLGNLNICALRSKTRYVWCIGDDDFLIPGALEQVLKIIRNSNHPIIYLNYAHMALDQSVNLHQAFVPVATRLKTTGECTLREAVQANSNLMTAIYTMVLRRDMAVQCYSVVSHEQPFASLNSCVPTTVFALSLDPKTKVYWIADPIIAVDLRVSWIRYAPVWILERFPEMILEFVAWGEGQVDLRYVFEELKPSINHWLDQSFSADFEKPTNFHFLRGLLTLYEGLNDGEIQQKLEFLS